ncbi:hypothetical protein A1O3_06854 [Capronia epimyces CBS 606.96]|uniref:SnoaL-like domain-containing protein n=1 Tax=Capronia epimyces CBS 606.96 TaxID=1182542 RepID=W9XR66_9EURO|nr:uncharacterized protein A1O3_06854 [Capronia epimyces CBS 606.96]EXJ83037.1 hypothetical protein A1O3_06854 [Capronia epimyces CBS 606.96]
MALSLEAQIQQLLDTQAIRDISALYNRYADAADGDKFAALWTEDGEFEIVGDKVYRGREEIAFACRAATEVLHFAVDSQVKIDGDKAEQASKLLLCHLAPDHKTLEFACTTTITDRFVKQEGKWFIKHRKSHTDLEFPVAIKAMGLVR